MADTIWQFELEEFIKQGVPDKVRKSEAWQTAIGLQAVDSLKTSDFLLDIAKEHIEGNITIDEAQERVLDFYSRKTDRSKAESRIREADIVSVRIAKLLGESSFEFSPARLAAIHRSLFDGVFKRAGEYRQYNVTKKEWVLKSGTVAYADFFDISDKLDRAFADEKQFSYEGLSVVESEKHLVKFTAAIWQTHPFFEGNTRAVGVFMIKYMQTLGFRINYEAFRDSSWFFRNSLVRANYNDPEKGIQATTKYLELFFENLLLGTNHKLKNRYLHIEYSEDKANGSDPTGSYNKFDSLNCTPEELEILKTIVKKPKISKRKIADYTGRSSETVKSCIRSLKEKKYIRKEKGLFSGRWKTSI